MNEASAMLEAHVQFELSRWRGPAFEETVAHEVAAAFRWLDVTPLADLVSVDVVTGVVQRVVVELPISDGLVALVDEGVHAAYDALADAETRLDALLRPESFDRFADLVAAAEAVRDVVTTQITSSEVYARLVSHVLYQGLKSYVLTQNVVARRVPGAGSLLRLGQSALSTAGLDKGIDRQLTAFVNAHVLETIRDSKAFLDETLDDARIRSIADEVWASNAARTVGWSVDLLGRGPLNEAVAAGRDVWLWVRETEFFAGVVARLVDAFFDRHGQQPAGELLANIGITADVVAGEFASAVAPVVARADAGGFLEERIREHLEQFYASYSGPIPQPAPARARKRRKQA
jgi:hypothetical protein